MLPLRYPGYWRAASGVLLFAVLAAALLPPGWFWPAPGPEHSWLDNADKWAHAIAFAMLALWFAGQYRPQSYWRIAIGLMAYGGLIEVCQRLTDFRQAEWFDVAADGAGIIVGLIIAGAGAGGWASQLENKLIGTKASTEC